MIRWRILERVFRFCYDLDCRDMFIMVLTIGKLGFVVELWQGDL